MSLQYKYCVLIGCILLHHAQEQGLVRRRRITVEWLQIQAFINKFNKLLSFTPTHMQRQILSRTAVVWGIGLPRTKAFEWQRLDNLEVAKRMGLYADAQWRIPKWHAYRSQVHGLSVPLVLKMCFSGLVLCFQIQYSICTPLGPWDETYSCTLHSSWHKTICLQVWIFNCLNVLLTIAKFSCSAGVRYVQRMGFYI